MTRRVQMLAWAGQRNIFCSAGITCRTPLWGF